ncbi:ABC transporter permease [bacterium (Candidatus Blackallbacteria) CG17_big_fil_post_rev_8_21_14_2_50_48_46]|uniref:ABC transporter permease n=1 Tax=bacterium (Candidatus Blackallbacteria) CG17_big_fil_post_rev_8_21_14_2_50_48_46 TaxID=2014261 RepID=A0A2M7G398_9BACT|nr:MAG: ABC transporter permease [bacterium (Candidatus Blackallbacteria) CG18_big_fil_WC_8_21_14_2_50_49_26]PIW16316.1 MAG: ABC transporter permease [bacterium (Candidatus Blackallbacteria) CG17_big_fil_post_rev_8_21_14_2_50_48_46]PIW45330.1 MAG: ABC transporter permease [bacterium (Candidatus Blackallbacteria) CG13_big_fil_rev_8_21_14_2_50_49_14]
MRSFPLALNTLREAIRDKILYVILLFSFILISSGILLKSLSLNQENKIVLDLGLSSISIFGLIITIFVGTNLLNKEIDKKTIYLLLSKPLNRSDFILGKFMGLSIMLLMIVASMGMAFYLVLWYTSGGLSGILPIFESSAQAILLIYIEMVLLTALAIFFSTFATPVMSAIFTLAAYTIGHMSNDIVSFGKLSQSPLVVQLTQFIFYLLPDLERLNLKNHLMSHAVSAEIFGGSIAYGLMYTLGLLLLSMVIFDFKEF